MIQCAFRRSGSRTGQHLAVPDKPFTQTGVFYILHALFFLHRRATEGSNVNAMSSVQARVQPRTTGKYRSASPGFMLRKFSRRSWPQDVSCS